MILDNILADKRIEVEERKSQVSLEEMKRRAVDAPAARDFAGALVGISGTPRGKDQGTGTPPSPPLAGGERGAGTPPSPPLAGGEHGAGTPPSPPLAGGERGAGTPTNPPLAWGERGAGTPPSPPLAGGERGAGTHPNPPLAGGERGAVRLIAEVKKASPSKGLIRADFDPVAISRIYEEAGASAISVLTDEKYFQGSLEYLKSIRTAVDLPLLRKDFVIDEYQIHEARAAGADAVLLIVAALTKGELAEFQEIAWRLGMTALVEVHTAEEMEVAVEIGAKVIGINNRNLQTFETTLDTTMDLASKAPKDSVLVSESGIFSRSDVERVASAGVSAILVGESLMREPDPGLKIRELLGEGRYERED